VWDILSRHGLRSVIVGVPQTYPPKPLNGCLVSGFLAPSTDAEFTYPKSLKDEIGEAVGEFILDVREFRTEDKAGLLERIHALMENRFATARYLMRAKPWDFFMVVDMGMDRLHHGFWRFCDPNHPKFEPGNPYGRVFREYYEAVDRHIGELIEFAGDETAIFVVSDHGARPMLGGVCINQWLINEGYLRLASPPREPARLEDCDVDWANTRAWSSGGYYARVFLNVAGREPEGIVPVSAYESCRAELAGRLASMPGPDGVPLRNQVLYPDHCYRQVNGVAPDLIVYFGDLAWRAVGTVGGGTLFVEENDAGPDDANHDVHGIFLMDDRSGKGSGEMHGLHAMDVAPTILSLLGVPIPDDFQGRALPALSAG
jgi:predicted AlkP superfamily phosphohydrolase/phosphomutase